MEREARKEKVLYDSSRKFALREELMALIRKTGQREEEETADGVGDDDEGREWERKCR